VKLHDSPEPEYPVGAAGVQKACEAMKAQWGKLFADASAKIEIELMPLSAQEMRHAIDKRDFDLAYHQIDFPDDKFWLCPSSIPIPMPCAPAAPITWATTMTRGFKTCSAPPWPREQFTALRDLQHSIHAHLVDRMPLIPLWRLHAHVAVQPTLNPVDLDPLLVFPNVLEWKWHNP